MFEHLDWIKVMLIGNGCVILLPYLQALTLFENCHLSA